MVVGAVHSGVSSAIFHIVLSCIGNGASGTQGKVDKAREGFIELYGKVLPLGTIILKKPDNEAVSEGIGFAGIILSNSNGTKCQDAYWQLYKARKAYFLKSNGVMANGVMAWKVSSAGRILESASASDGDQDWIASELIVLAKLKSGTWSLPEGMTLSVFESEIRADLDAFWKAHVKKVNGRLIFMSSDGRWAKRGDGKNVYYPSYPDPYFLREFAKFDTTHDWGKLANDVQDLNQQIFDNHQGLGAAGQNPMPGKVFVSVRGDGTYRVENYYTISKREGVRGEALKDNEVDSIRFLLRAARSAILGQDQRSVSLLSSLLTTANIDLTNPHSAHILAGSKGAPSKYGWPNTLARASYGIAIMATQGKDSSETFFDSVVRDHKGKFFGEWDGAKNYYYDQSLIMQIMDLYLN